MAHSRDKLLRLAIFAYAAFALLWFGAQCFSIGQAAAREQLTVSTQNNQILLTEFFQFYRQAKIGNTDYKDKIFDPDVLEQVGNQILSPARINQRMKIVSSPITLLMIAPFTYLSPSLAQVSFELLAVILSILAVAALSRVVVPEQRVNTALLVCLGMLASWPGLANIYVGQLSLVVLAGVAFFFAAWWQKKDLLAGIFLVVTAIKFQYLPFLIIAPLMQRRWKVIASFIVAALVTIVAIAIWCPTSIFQYFPNLVNTDLKPDDGYSNWMICIRGMWFQLLPKSYAIVLSALSTLSGLAVLAWLWKIAKIERKIDHAVMISVTVISSLIFSPHSFSVDLVILAVPAVMLAPLALAPDGLAKEPAFKIYFGLLALFPILSWLISVIPLPIMPWSSLHITELHAYLPYNALMLYLLARAAWKANVFAKTS
jgi:hypothetical protein